MNDQTTQENPSAPRILPAKRRRGRPRKDEGPAKRMILQNPVSPAPEMRQKDITTDENMLGQIVSGVIDGTFDAGYFLSVKLGNNATTLRGLIFEPGRFSPITAANDIAPQVKMHHRSQVITLQDQENGTNKQLNTSPGRVLLPSDHPLARNDQRANPDQMFKVQSQVPPLLENLRMVEQDEVMEVFEVANQPEGLELNAEQGKCSNGQKTQNQLMDSNSIIQTGSNDDIHQHSNNVVDGSQGMGSDQKHIESEVEKNKSNLETLLQPRELVHCELKKLEIHRAPPIDAQIQVTPKINPEPQPEDLSQDRQGNQDSQPHQTPPFVELNSVAAPESELQPSDHPMHNELHYVDMPQHNVTSDDTQVLPQESIIESVDFAMETQNSPKEKHSDVGAEVEVVGKEEASNERE